MGAVDEAGRCREERPAQKPSTWGRWNGARIAATGGKSVRDAASRHSLPRDRANAARHLPGAAGPGGRKG